MKQRETTDGAEHLASDTVMELTRMGATWPSKFSFSHSFLHTVAKLGFECHLRANTLDDEGRGHIAYSATVGREKLTFVVFSDPLDESEQQDRIIATRWDAWAALFLGQPSQADIARSRQEIQDVTWGRATPGTITWSRANRSARLFTHVIDALANRRQPDPRQLNEVGYLIRTTGFSGNGRNGMHDFEYLRQINHPLQAPYHAQMLAAYLWREFGFDLATHLAKVRNPNAVDLSADIRRFVGVGNSSGIGLVPFVVRHPQLIHRWIEVREEALAELVDTRFGASDSRCDAFERLLARAVDYFIREPQGEIDEFVSGAVLAAELAQLRIEFDRLRTASASVNGSAGHRQSSPVTALLRGSFAATVSREARELLASLALEIHEEGQVDPRALYADESLSFPPTLKVGELRAMVVERFGWISRFKTEIGRPYFWYASEENMEPRRGRRGIDEGEQYQLPVDILGRLEELMSLLAEAPPAQSVGRFLVSHPDMRFMAAWAYSLADRKYAVSRTDLLAFEFSPLRLMRFQLAMYGMLKFRPRSNTWLRATLFQGAGLPHELAAGQVGDGLFPVAPASDLPLAEVLIGE